jgi:hypothetical protein
MNERDANLVRVELTMADTHLPLGTAYLRRDTATLGDVLIAFRPMIVEFANSWEASAGSYEISHLLNTPVADCAPLRSFPEHYRDGIHFWVRFPVSFIARMNQVNKQRNTRPGYVMLPSWV